MWEVSPKMTRMKGPIIRFGSSSGTRPWLGSFWLNEEVEILLRTLHDLETEMACPQYQFTLPDLVSCWHSAIRVAGQDGERGAPPVSIHGTLKVGPPPRKCCRRPGFIVYKNETTLKNFVEWINHLDPNILIPMVCEPFGQTTNSIFRHCCLQRCQ